MFSADYFGLIVWVTCLKTCLTLPQKNFPKIICHIGLILNLRDLKIALYPTKIIFSIEIEISKLPYYR